MTDIDTDLLKDLLWVAAEEVGTLEGLLVQMERGPTVEGINQTYRIMHSLKGSAGLVRLHQLEQAGHLGEQLLQPCRNDPSRFSSEITSTMLVFLDCVKRDLKSLELDAVEAEAVFSPFVSAVAGLGADDGGRPRGPSRRRLRLRSPLLLRRPRPPPPLSPPPPPSHRRRRSPPRPSARWRPRRRCPPPRSSPTRRCGWMWACSTGS